LLGTVFVHTAASDFVDLRRFRHESRFVVPDATDRTNPRMKKMVANLDSCSQSRADTYAAYLETPEGRLRLDLALANLQDFLPQCTPPLCALDIGGGTGAIAVRLARLGLHVTLLDESMAMLDLAKCAAQEAGVAERVALINGDAAQLHTPSAHSRLT
jgi:2-polyprenyl-3-methyl-5-hydroxy-6-metoxy-1,4-benzoquinol methylase